MPILRLLPIALMAAILTACTSVQSAPPASSAVTGASSDLKTNGSSRETLGKISDSNTGDTISIKSSVSASDRPFDYKETIVSRKIAQLRKDKEKIQNFYSAYETRLRELQGRSETATRDYYGTVAHINARLQGGTTPGNPILVEQSQLAQSKLEAISADINVLTGLSNDISSNASIASYLLEAVRATYGLSGAVDQDHVALTQLEDEVNRLVVQIDRQLTDINNDINRRTSYLATERRNLQTLTLAIANGELYGQSISNRAFFSPTTALPGDPDLANARLGQQGGFNQSKPLVVIRFDRANVDYQQAVYTASSEALQRYPNVSFEVVAVAPMGSNPAQSSLANSDAQSNAQGVVRSLTQMGVPANRIKLSSTRSPQARSPEVHIFLR